MRQERVNVWNANEYDYPASYGFIPNIHTYIHEDKSSMIEATIRSC